MTNYKKNVSNDFDIKGAIILVLTLIIIVLVMFILTLGAQKLGWFDLGYTKPDISSAVISYETSLAGTIFNKQSGEYYVLIADFDKDFYISSLGAMYKSKSGDKLNLYTVNLSNEMNKSIIGEVSNPSAQSVADLKVSGPTLILIRDGRNVRCVEGEENIKAELGV